MDKRLTALVIGWLCAGGLLANPMPTEEPWSSGRLVPATAVPVDVVHERLSAEIVPAGTWWAGKVTARYRLAADTAVTVPIVFPFTGPADDVRFELDGRPVPVVRLSLTALLQPYADTWRQTVRQRLTADPRLVAAVAATEASADRDARRWRLSTLAGGWLRQTAGDGAEGLLADWLTTETESLPALRRLALALDPSVPDPLALAEACAGGAEPTVGFAAARLPLRAGANELMVSFRQPLGRVNRLRSPVAPAADGYVDYRPAVRSLPVFSYIVRTAAHWRSFGQLEARVRLPAGASDVECAEPEARCELSSGARTVSWRVSGVPARDVRVILSPQRFVHGDLPPNRDGFLFSGQGAPSVRLPLRWSRLVEGEGPGAAPAVDADRGRVFVCRGNRGLLLGLADGAVQREWELPMAPGVAALAGDRVAMAGSGDSARAVAACDTSGRLVWQSKSPIDVARLAIVGDVLLGWTETAYTTWRLSDGRPLQTGSPGWQAMVPGAGGLIYTAAVARNFSPEWLVMIHASDPATGKRLWRWYGTGVDATLRLDPRWGLMAVIARRDEKLPWRFVALDADTGRQRWDRPVPSLRLSTPMVSAKFAFEPPLFTYVTGYSVRRVGYSADGRPTLLPATWLGGESPAEVAIAGDDYYLSGDMGLLAVSQADGQPRWRCTLPGLRGMPVIGGHRLLAGQLGVLSAFDEPFSGELLPPDSEVPRVGRLPADLAGHLGLGAN